MEREVDKATFKALVESSVPTISDFSISFALPRLERKSIDAGLGGSGTLITIDKTQGILTANHVLKNLVEHKTVGLILPSRFKPKIHNLNFQMENCNHFGFSCKDKESDGPDLAFLVPPPDVLSTLRAEKSFYNLSQRQNRMRESPPPTSDGFWVLAGTANDWTSEGLPESGFSKVKYFRGMCGATIVTREFKREEFDYIVCEALYNEYYEGPNSYEGFSGGGLWQALVAPNGNSLKIASTMLCGVIFYQSVPLSGVGGEITRNITCHGRQSIYRNMIQAVRERFPA